MRKKATGKNPESPAVTAKRVAGFIAKFHPPVARLIGAARRVLRKRFPTAVELVYDNYNALAIGYGPNERASEVIVSLAAYARGVNLYFIRGAALSDPLNLLEGSGSRGRFVRLENLGVFKKPGVPALLRAAVALGKTPLPARTRGYTVIKSVSAKQRPRKPSARH